jgi:hypothetical protein
MFRNFLSVVSVFVAKLYKGLNVLTPCASLICIVTYVEVLSQNPDEVIEFQNVLLLG